MRQALLILFFLSAIPYGYTWNAIGHQLVAQIAYDNLTPAAKRMCNLYSHSRAKTSNSFVKSASWLDSIRENDIHWYDALHYIDIPFSKDGTALPPQPEINALWGIKQSVKVLASNKAKVTDKKLSLRILTHLVGDIHQPLHTVTKINEKLPKGDLGGNLFQLGQNPIGNNLHKYWDNGGGALMGRGKLSQIKNKAKQLEKKWTCQLATKEKDPRQWVNASHQLALTQVYIVSPHEIPSKRYQINTQKITEKQIFWAGCRLAFLLNKIAEEQNRFT
ncbi:3'-nucleotidase [Legionella norrlandica]|uniref:3'-nucleotidase n=1 Tax=Legionella norrlandica TaxID=1498499 RepID=A0A0A2SSZ1_9GAMM|nr:S1/P1 nuclease [Legionella norrlandica]KGP63847.1 3'-nucleotidase [Legionella norrlandica]